MYYINTTILKYIFSNNILYYSLTTSYIDFFFLDDDDEEEVVQEIGNYSTITALEILFHLSKRVSWIALCPSRNFFHKSIIV